MTKNNGDASYCEAQPRTEARENFTPAQQPEWGNISRQCLADNSVWQTARGGQGGDPTLDRVALSSGFLQFGSINDLTGKQCKPGEPINMCKPGEAQMSTPEAGARATDNSPQSKAAALFDKNTTDEQKLATVRELANSGVKTLNYRDESGTEHKLRLETLNGRSGNQMVHMFASGADGREQIALRGIAKADGSFERQKDSRGNYVDFKGKGFSDIGSEKPESLNVDASGPTKHERREMSPPAKREQQRTLRDMANESSDSTRPVAKPGSIDRSRFDAELKDPKVMAAFAGRLHSEVGSQGPAAHVAFAEKVMNRATSRNQTLMQALSGSYYPTHHPGRSNNPKYIEAITKAWKEGTDTTLGATGNASGKVGFGVKGGHYDANRHWVSPNQTVRINGERFGYEQTDINRGWLKKYEQLKIGSRV